MITTTTVDVRLWGISVGKLQWDNEKDLAVFQFSKEYTQKPSNRTSFKKSSQKKSRIFCEDGRISTNQPVFRYRRAKTG